MSLDREYVVLKRQFEDLRTEYGRKNTMCNRLYDEYQELKSHCEDLQTDYDILAQKWGAVKEFISDERLAKVTASKKKSPSKRRSPNKAPSSSKLKQQHDAIHRGKASVRFA